MYMIQKEQKLILAYTVRKSGDDSVISVGIPVSYLKDAIYPITIDPTIQISDSNVKDAELDGLTPNTNHGSEVTMRLDATRPFFFKYCWI